MPSGSKRMNSVVSTKWAAVLQERTFIAWIKTEDDACDWSFIIEENQKENLNANEASERFRMSAVCGVTKRYNMSSHNCSVSTFSAKHTEIVTFSAESWSLSFPGCCGDLAALFSLSWPCSIFHSRRYQSPQWQIGNLAGRGGKK